MALVERQNSRGDHKLIYLYIKQRTLQGQRVFEVFPDSYSTSNFSQNDFLTEYISMALSSYILSSVYIWGCVFSVCPFPLWLLK